MILVLDYSTGIEKYKENKLNLLYALFTMFSLFSGSLGTKSTTTFFFFFLHVNLAVSRFGHSESASELGSFLSSGF